MPSYTRDELEKDWEFKIVRSASGVFRKPQTFANLVEEEGMAGWEMVEKLDDQRVRFKRHRSERQRDAQLPPGVDPYRTQYGANTNIAAVSVALVLGLLMALGVVIFILLGTETLPSMPIASIVVFTIPAILIMGVLVAMVAYIRRR